MARANFCIATVHCTIEPYTFFQIVWCSSSFSKLRNFLSRTMWHSHCINSEEEAVTCDWASHSTRYYFIVTRVWHFGDYIHFLNNNNTTQQRKCSSAYFKYCITKKFVSISVRKHQWNHSKFVHSYHRTITDIVTNKQLNMHFGKKSSSLNNTHERIM